MKIIVFFKRALTLDCENYDNNVDTKSCIFSLHQITYHDLILNWG